MARDEAKLSEFAERSAAVLTSAGFPRMASRVLMALTVSETGLTAADLAERLSASAAAISGAVRYLQSFGMVHRVEQAGSRRDVYELPDNPWFAAGVSEDRIYGTLSSLAEGMPEAAGGSDTVVGARIAEMSDFLQFFRRRLPELLDEWLKSRR
jgi:hypothetical protein